MARRPHDGAAYAARVRRAVADVVREQVDHGLDVIDDGEMSKPRFITYVTERLSGFTRSTEPGTLPWAGSKEVIAFPEFYAPMLREKDVTLPEGAVLIPGVITQSTVLVEHVADRIERFAAVVGGDNVIAGADCGFATFAAGARLASQRLWSRGYQA